MQGIYDNFGFCSRQTGKTYSLDKRTLLGDSLESFLRRLGSLKLNHQLLDRLYSAINKISGNSRVNPREVLQRHVEERSVGSFSRL